MRLGSLLFIKLFLLRAFFDYFFSNLRPDVIDGKFHADFVGNMT